MYKSIILLVVICLLTQCEQNVRIENTRTEHNQNRDSLDITSFSLKRSYDDKLADWEPYQINNEIISVPPNWSGKILNQTFALTPPNSIGNSEVLTFRRLYRDSTMNYDVIAQQLITKSFANYSLVKEDTIKKVILAKDFFFERNCLLSKKSVNYKGYTMVYVDDEYMYIYNMALSLNRVKTYEGDIFKDIFGNIKINNRYFLRSDNPIKKIIYIH